MATNSTTTSLASEHEYDKDSGLGFATGFRSKLPRRTSIEMATFGGFSPYEIPLSTTPDVDLEDYSLPSINAVTSSLEYGHKDNGIGKTLRKSASTDAEKKKDGHMPHGFFFGARSTELLANAEEGEGGGASGKENHTSCTNSTNSTQQFVDDDEDGSLFDDADIGVIYAQNQLERWIRASQHSFKPSPETIKREVLSKRIKDVGSIGMNLGIGHLIGIMKEDSALIPKEIKLQSTHLYISEESPVQHDLCWSLPENAAIFSALTFDLEVILPDHETWSPISSVRHPVLRIYHTDHRLFVGKHRVDRKNNDLILWLRVCCRGEMTNSERAKYWLKGPWSKEAQLKFIGYGTQPSVIEQTAL